MLLSTLPPMPFQEFGEMFWDPFEGQLRRAAEESENALFMTKKGGDDRRNGPDADKVGTWK